MLTTSKNMIYEAKAGKYAIGCFNASDLEIVKAIIKAAESQKSPVIVATSPKAIEYVGLENIADIIINEAKSAKVPVALHLDHGLTLGLVQECLDQGYTSIMFDGSGSNLEHNEILTRQAVESSHVKNVPCEGELGHLGKAGPSTVLGINKGTKTNPEDVIPFIQKTAVDFLAVSVGSSHGISDDEKLDIDLLKKINSKTAIPLVLHGASGVSGSDIKKAIANGIAKINIDTDIRHTFVKGLKSYLDKNPKSEDPREVLNKVMADIQELVEEKIKLFGSSGKG